MPAKVMGAWSKRNNVWESRMASFYSVLLPEGRAVRRGDLDQPGSFYKQLTSSPFNRIINVRIKGTAAR